MPRIVIEGFRISVYTRDEKGHRPHVHVYRAGTKVQVFLDASLTAYNVQKMSSRDVARARELVGSHFGTLMKWWEQYNG